MTMLSSGASSILAMAGLAWLTWHVFDTARRRAGESPRRRQAMFAGSLLMLGLGGAVAFWLPHKVPDTPGSPAALVGIALLWLIGGGFLYVGTVSGLGAALARRPAAES